MDNKVLFGTMAYLAKAISEDHIIDMMEETIAEFKTARINGKDTHKSFSRLASYGMLANLKCAGISPEQAIKDFEELQRTRELIKPSQQ